VRRRGFTLVESLISVVLSLLIFAAAMGLSRMGDRLNRAAMGSASLTAMRLLEEALIVDFRQLARDPFGAEVMHITDGGASFHVARLAGDAVALDAVRYQRVAGEQGQVFLARTETLPGGGSSMRVLSSTPLTAVHFRAITDRDTQQRFLAVDAVASDTSAPASRGEPFTLVFAIRPAAGPALAPLAPSVAVAPYPPLLPLE